MTIPGFAPYQFQNINDELVAIISVDTTTHIAQGLTRHRDTIKIRWDVPVGGMYVTPAQGEQWYVARLDNSYWKLSTRVPFNDNNTLIEPVPGQMIIGGTGPVELNGSELKVHGDTTINGQLTVGDTIMRGDGGNLEQSSDGGATWDPVGSGATGGGDIEDITGLTEALALKADLVDGKVRPEISFRPIDTGPIRDRRHHRPERRPGRQGQPVHTHTETEITAWWTIWRARPPSTTPTAPTAPRWTRTWSTSARSRRSRRTSSSTGPATGSTAPPAS